MTTTLGSQPTKIRPWRYLWNIVRYRPWLYLGLGVFETMFFGVFPQIAGFIIRMVFDQLSGDITPGKNIYTLIALLIGVAGAKAVAIFIDVWIYFNFQYTIRALLRGNLFTHILRRPGARAVPNSPGEAVSRFRDDVDEVAFYMSESLILLGFGFFAAVALVVMFQTDPLITLVVLIPLIIVIVVSNAATKAIEKYREASRQATAQVTGFIGELFGAVQAVQVATAENRVIEHFTNINARRKEAAVKDRLFGEVLRSVFQNTANLGTGIILLLVGSKMSSGTFSIGDFALFVYYLGFTADFAGLLGEHLAWIKRVGVSLARLFKLADDVPPETVVQHNPIYLHKELPEVPYIRKNCDHHLEVLEGRYLTYHYEDSQRGISGINLTILRGSFTVVTGRIGSGKTTLIRALLGLLPLQEGDILWNGQFISNPGSFLVPPRVAYTPQVPILFSESLRDNILMGLPLEEVDLDAAIHQAVLEKDIKDFEHGLDTMLGPKGVKLSGGQRQRSAAARMFVREPELLVFDDISSALDVETERMLWERVFSMREATCLVVSHRVPALRRADNIIVLKDGQVTAEGKLEALLENCEEMQRLLQGEIREGTMA
jgi:ATP-binding cassette subfamily B protein